MDIDSSPRSWAEPLIVALAVIVPGLAPSPAPAEATGWLISGAAQSASQFALLVIIIGASGRLRDYGVHRLRATDVIRAAPLFGLLLLISRLSVALTALAGFGTPDQPSFLPSPGNASPAVMLVLCALFSVAVGYREELFYRLYIVGALRERGAGAAPAVAVSALVFAAGHAWQGFPGIISALLVGIVMAAAVIKGARLHSLALAHAAYDFGVLIAAFGLAG